MDLKSTLKLHNGVEIPRVGLGVFRAGEGDSTKNAVKAALSLGVRHFDTAAIYRNEQEVGEAIRESGVPREELFVTTKLWNDDHGHESAVVAFENSRKALGLEYIDLYLIHWPVPRLRIESWRAMETLLEDGRCRAIGVSNFTGAHLEDLIRRSSIKPMINQFEIHPFLQQREIVEATKKLGIVVEAYSPLTKGRRLDDPALLELAKETGRSVAQVMIRWSLQKGNVVIPKSSNPARIKENFSIFDFALSDEQMARLDGLEDGFRCAWDPTTIP